MTIKVYKWLEISMFSILCILAQLISYFGIKSQSDAPFYVSFSILISCICILKWGIEGSVPYLLCGILNIILGPSSLKILSKIIIYFLGNIGIVFGTITFLFIDRRKIKNSLVMLLIFYFSCTIGVLFSRTISYLVCGYTFEYSIRVIISAMLLDFVIGLIVFIILFKVGQSVLTDGIEYVKSLKKTEEEQSE